MQRSGALAVVLIVVVVLLVGTAGVLGWAVGDQTASKTKTIVASGGTAPSGHMGGQNLLVSQVGNPARGAQLWQSKHCSDCHSYAGRGGEDAPPLDFMRGHLSGREIADMSGQIWNHVPEMLHHFKEEGIPFPTFTQGQMADLIAFLHSGKGAKAGAHGGHQGGMNMPGMKEGHMGAGGKAVFLKAGCGSCHTLSAAGTQASVGPDLDTALKGKSAAFVKQSILDPNAAIASGYQGDVMPTTYGSQLSGKEVDELVAFVMDQQ